MLVRIKGVVDDILNVEGRKKSDNSPWAKKVYVIKDNTHDKDEYNTKVHVNDFGKLDPNSSEPVFFFKSNHLVGDEVDLACFLETNDNGFTNVNYGKPYADIQKPAGTGNVVRPTDDAPVPVGMQPQEEETDLPF